MTASDAKISMLNNSVKCFVYGLLGLLPVIGLFFAFAALTFSFKARTQETKFWNAARPYRIWGMIFAGIGIAFCFITVVTVCFNIIHSIYGSGGGIYNMSGDE
jgi:hypothetical protein